MKKKNKQKLRLDLKDAIQRERNAKIYKSKMRRYQTNK